MTINKRYSLVLTLSLVVGLIIARTEIMSALGARESWGALISRVGIVAISFYGILSVAGIFLILVGLWKPSTFQKDFPPGPAWMRWLSAVVLLAIVLWVYLFSPWRLILTGTWTQLIFAVVFVQIVSLLLSPGRVAFHQLSEVALTAFVFLLPRIVLEVRLATKSSLTSHVLEVLGFLLIILLALALYHPLGEQIASWLQDLRARLGKFRQWLVAFLWITPILYHYGAGVEATILYPNLRFALLLLAWWLASYLSYDQKDRLVPFDSLAINFCVLMLVYRIDNYLLVVNDYPFSFTWSEGNRFYDYSLVFGQSLYNHVGAIINPYGTPGRYALWGIVFLWKSAPIWMHRLWNVMLQIVPPLLFAIFLTKKIRPDATRRLTLFGIALFFIVLAPLHPPFMLGSVIVAWFAFDESPVKRGLSLLVAASYLAISRWTWVLAPAAMAALIDLFLYYPQRSGNWFRRLLPAVAMVVIGVAPGLYINFGTFQDAVSGDLTAVQQPLLWYRLLPNSTLGPGVFFLTLLYTAPLLIVIAWWMYSKQWKLDIWQKLAAWGALAGFLGVGLVISTKIGGGGDLHNLDMYLVTLMLVVALGLTQVPRSIENLRLPVRLASVFMLFMLSAVYQKTPVTLVQSDGSQSATVQRILSKVRTEVEAASENGEVLFMDQRQLLTFGYMPAIPFVPDYEKKYMMDQAMASNARYFKTYYQDLANRRFTLIVSEVLQSKLKSELGGYFSEENDAFVTWVSNPTLCFYEPIFTSRETNIMLLAPKANPQGCEEYLK